MSQPQDNIQQLLDNIHSGSSAAMRDFLDRYGNFILRVIRQKLEADARPVFDSLDFLQDVWASFFKGQLRREFQHTDALLAYLVVLARNKVASEMRKRLMGKRFSLMPERSLDGSVREAALLVPTNEPSPVEVAATREEWERLLRNLPFHHRQILEMARAGHTQLEIADSLGLNEKTVRRLLQKLASKCQQRLRQAAS